MMLRQIREKGFQNDLQPAFRDDYEKIGILFGVFILSLKRIEAGRVHMVCMSLENRRKEAEVTTIVKFFNQWSDVQHLCKALSCC